MSKHVVELLFSRPRKPTLTSFIITLFTKKWLKDTPFQKKVPTHTAILIDGRRVVEAVPFDGVVITPFDKWIEKNEIICAGNCIQGPNRLEILINRKALFEALRSIHESQYDWLGAILAGIRSLFYSIFGAIPKWLERNPVSMNNKYYCVEVVFLFFSQYLYYHIEWNGHIFVMSPAEILSKISKEGRR